MRNPIVRMIHTNRDLLLLRIGGGRVLVEACDAAGGIGSKSNDNVKASSRIVGKMTARVALMELLSVGAEPISIVAALAVEPKPTGNRILRGIMDEVRYAGYGRLPITSSSEKNVSVSQTGVGVTVLGYLAMSQLKIGRCRLGDELVAVGEPRVKGEVLEGERDRLIADTNDVSKLQHCTFVHEMIPAGSRGIWHEAGVLAKDSKLSITKASSSIDLEKSAGPSTVLLLAAPIGHLNDLKRIVHPKPTTTIGHFHRK
ncbi:MAG TPA: hypothetical protein VLV31_00340 [Candidatus Acidoferrales bacterium]|nr:hypothetical protein [Candidatus Acidoferrales bacterium]